MMSKKEYIRAAEIVRLNRPNGTTKALIETRNLLEDSFVEFFRGDNPRFDEDRFREACKEKDNRS